MINMLYYNFFGNPSLQMFRNKETHFNFCLPCLGWQRSHFKMISILKLTYQKKTIIPFLNSDVGSLKFTQHFLNRFYDSISWNKISVVRLHLTEIRGAWTFLRFWRFVALLHWQNNFQGDLLRSVHLRTTGITTSMQQICKSHPQHLDGQLKITTVLITHRARIRRASYTHVRQIYTLGEITEVTISVKYQTYI
jgi:hypothetical protein